jgi:alkanesulfonate monooxygenase SsuD/methylene tetrahydromethanopterin reductase-like flavin-dependent oxidoreductase (luciferase family)
LMPKGVSLEDFMQTSFVGTPEDFIKQLRQYMNLGVTHFMLFFVDLPDLRGLRLFAKKVVKKID